MSMRFKTVAAGAAMIALSGAAFAGGSSVPTQTGSAPSAQVAQTSVVTSGLTAVIAVPQGSSGSLVSTGQVVTLTNLGGAVTKLYSGTSSSLGGGFGGSAAGGSDN